MDGNPTSTSTFELGGDFDGENDENLSIASSLETSCISNESILASSHQNTTMDFPLSAPSSIARNKILACSTPKDQIPAESENKPTVTPNAPTAGIAVNVYSPKWKLQCKDRRDIYRTGGFRNMAATPPRPGTENIKNSYFTKENRPIIEAFRRRSQEKTQNEQRLAERRENFKLLGENAIEFVFSAMITIWQILYMANMIPNDDIVCYCANFAACAAYAIMFMAPHPILWAIVSCSFIVYLSFVWLFGATCAIGYFAFAAVFAKASVTVLQAVVLIAG